MEENRIQNQIAIYMTNRKLCEFTDKLKSASPALYAHLHAQGEKQEDGTKARSCVGIVLQDYSNGTGDKTVRVTANLAPEFFPYALSKAKNGDERFDFQEDKIFGEPDQEGLSTVTKVSIRRSSVGTDGKPRNYPWCVIVENGKGIRETTHTGGIHMQKGSYRKERSVFVNISDFDFFCLMQQVCRFISAWELSYGPRVIRDGRQQLEAQRAPGAAAGGASK